MAAKTKLTGLGKGLNAIFEIEHHANPIANVQTNNIGTINEIELSLIEANTDQPRRTFDAENLEELKNSILRMGVIQPITVRKIEGSDRYMIISGERRFRASKLAGKKSIIAYVREAQDEEVLEMALIENIQREDLNAMDIAVSMQRLMDEYSLTQEALAEKVGKKRSTVANYTRLLKLPAQVQMAICEDIISMGHARAIAGIGTEQEQIEMLDRIIQLGLSVRQTEEAVARKSENQDNQENQDQLNTQKKETATVYPDFYQTLSQKLEQITGKNISIKRSEKGRGQIVIRFTDDKQIQEIVDKLNS